MTTKKTKPAKNPKHRTMSFKKAQRLRNERVAKFLVDMSRPLTCDLCNDDDRVGFVDDARTFKVCNRCDTDGADFNPKDWPQEVLDEINIDRDTDEYIIEQEVILCRDCGASSNLTECTCAKEGEE